jgi:DNA gyrase subunit A
VNSGIAYSKKAYQIPVAARTAKGVPLPQVLPIGQQEKVTAVVPVASFTAPSPRNNNSSSSSSPSASASARGDTSKGMSKGKDKGASKKIAPTPEEAAASPQLVLLTSRGVLKKTSLAPFSSISSRGLVIMKLDEGDSLRWARICLEGEDVLIATK